MILAIKTVFGPNSDVGSAIGGAAGNVIAPGIGGTIGGGLGGLAGMAVDRTDDCFFYMFGVQCVGERAVITFANDGAYPTSINYADLVIIQVPYYWY